MEVEGGSHLVLWEGDLEDEAKSTTPTRTLPRMWTMAEVKWFAKRWSYDENACDKVGSGEYALQRPPKKPGGISRTILFFLASLWGSMARTEVSKRTNLTM